QRHAGQHRDRRRPAVAAAARQMSGSGPRLAPLPPEHSPELADQFASFLKTPGAIFAELRAHWSEEQIVEIVATIAMAGFLARWNGTMATPLEDEPREVAEKHLAPQGWSAGIHGA